jgi:phage tail-like protein
MANLDPLEECSFQVDWGGSRIGMLRVSPVKLTTSVAVHRDGSNPTFSNQKMPGLTTYEPVTLEREIVPHDADFWWWMNQVLTEGGGGSGYKRDVTIRMLDGQHSPIVVVSLRNCWPSAYEALPELNAEGTGVAIERLTLEYESFNYSNP